MGYKKNVAIKVNYVALHRTAGLTDLDMKVYDEAGVLFATVTLTEIVGGGGAYYGSFTPDEKGQWRIRIQSATNHDDVQKVFEISNNDVDDVKSQLDTVEGKIDVIDGNVTSIKGTVETTDGKVDTVITDVAAVKGVVDSTETKVDGMITKLQDIDDQISTGGYIMN